MAIRAVCVLRTPCLLGVVITIGGMATTALAQSQPLVAKATSPAGSFAVRRAAAKDFVVPPTNADLYAGDLLVALPHATLQSPAGSVTVKSFADYDGRSPLPILETALLLGPPEKGLDLVFTLDRGRVDITNTREQGPSQVKVHFWDQTWVIQLDEPGTRIALEFCGRWPAGARFRVADPKSETPAAVPVATLVLLVLKGSGQITSGDTTVAVSAPPGPAVMEWDSVHGGSAQPQKLAQLPDWANADQALSERGQKVAAAVEKFRQARAQNPEAALQQFLDSPEPLEQRLALITLGALDELSRLGQALVNAKTLDEWDFGITVLRHWLGRAPGQDQKFYQHLITMRDYTPAQAKTILQLLFGFSPNLLQIPETYEVLIDYLGHEKAAIRNLAAWHLIRLVPEGKNIPFKPNGTVAEAEKTQHEWRRLIPPGELPPARKKK
ncbi:MAG: hypothetical protein RMJ56_00905 [Gemmataceae bacterium]|nr:hypothetical protein [Gemmata sp.]MDW8196140.1 hypothetical protein [Gemmataceae bacterium]